MKKIISLLLLACLAVTALAGCGTTLSGTDKGAIINVYIDSDPFDLDPAVSFNNDGAVKFFGLIYEGLTRLNNKGKWEYALMKSYKVVENAAENEYCLQITLNNTQWSDGSYVTADDVVFAWNRILDPEFDSPAAPLLYDIRNAREVKEGDVSVYNLGIKAEDANLLYVYFDHPIDYDLFFEKVACPALVPLRENVVARYSNFGQGSTMLVCNGPFAVKGWENGEKMTLDRNIYYYRDTSEDPLDKQILPYRLVLNFTGAEKATADYEAGTLFYLDEIALAKRAEYKKDAKVTDTFSTTSVVFNTEKDLFTNAGVRKALSLALDRQAIADTVVFAKPATGLIPFPVFDKKNGDSFRKNGGDILATSADAGAAKSALGSKSGSFTLAYLNDPVNEAIANTCKSSWEALGMKVKLDALSAKEFQAAWRENDYDAILIDFQSVATDAFGILAIFSINFSGMGIDIQNENYDPVPFIPGYENKAYTDLIEQAFAESDRAKKSEILHSAEAMLMEDLPIVPIIFNQDAYVINKSVLSDWGDYYYGFRYFNRLKMKNYLDYQTEEAK